VYVLLAVNDDNLKLVATELHIIKIVIAYENAEVQKRNNNYRYRFRCDAFSKFQQQIATAMQGPFSRMWWKQSKRNCFCVTSSEVSFLVTSIARFSTQSQTDVCHPKIKLSLTPAMRLGRKTEREVKRFMRRSDSNVSCVGW